MAEEHLGRSPVAQGLMRPLVVVEVEVGPQFFARFRHRSAAPWPLTRPAEAVGLSGQPSLRLPPP